MKDLVSIIVPTFNREKSVMITIASACAGSYRPLEIIVVDDGSTDGTRSLAGTIYDVCEKAGVLCHFITQTNQGASAARNQGLSQATGEFVNFLDSDDIHYPDAMETLVKELKGDPDLDVAYGKVDVIESRSHARIEEMGKAPEGTDHDMIHYLWHTMGALYRKLALEEVGAWNTRLTLGDDWELSSKVKISGATYRFLPLSIGAYYKHDGASLTTDQFNLRHCTSVVDSAYSIYQFSKELGRTSNTIRQRCWNRIFIHALELSVHDSNPGADRAFSMCRRMGSPNIPLRLLYYFLMALPIKSLRAHIFRLIRSRS